MKKREKQWKINIVFSSMICFSENLLAHRQVNFFGRKSNFRPNDPNKLAHWSLNIYWYDPIKSLNDLLKYLKEKKKAVFYFVTYLFHQLFHYIWPVSRHIVHLNLIALLFTANSWVHTLQALWCMNLRPKQDSDRY